MWFVVGTSPEFELAVYTLCFVARPNEVCRLRINGNDVFIQTLEEDRGHQHVFGRKVREAYILTGAH